MPKHGGVDMMWYSWNQGNVHFISYSTEVYYYDTQDQQAQMDWLLADLAEANLPENRAAQPWIIAYGHRYASHHPTAPSLVISSLSFDVSF